MTTPRRGVRVLFWSELFPPYIGGNELVAAGLLPRAIRKLSESYPGITVRVYDGVASTVVGKPTERTQCHLRQHLFA